MTLPLPTSPMTASASGSSGSWTFGCTTSIRSLALAVSGMSASRTAFTKRLGSVELDPHREPHGLLALLSDAGARRHDVPDVHGKSHCTSANAITRRGRAP